MKYRLGDLTVKEWNSWDRVPRDPVTVGTVIISAAGGSTALATTTLFFGMTTVAGVVGYIATTAVTGWALSALAPKPDFGGVGTSSAGILVNAKDAAAAQEFVYGEIRKGGVITYYQSSGTDNKYLHQIIALAGHELNSIGDIYLNDEIATINGSGYVTSQSWNSKIFIRKFTGASGQDVKSTLDGISSFAGPSLPANFRGDGIACLYVRYEYDQDAFPNGLPKVTAKVQGKKVYDPRSSTTAYSNNAALCIRDFITSSYGLADDSIDDTSFSAAANECDEDVTLSGGSDTEDRYTINGIVRSNRNTGAVLQDMTTACAGTLFWGCGAWKLKVGVYSDPVNAGDPLTLDDVRSPITFDTKITMRDNFNTVTGTFIDAEQDYITSDYPQLSSTVFKAQDGDEEVILDLPLPYTTSAATAQRLAKLTLFRGREQMTINADFGLKAFEYEVGDIIEFSNERYFGSANPVKEFEIVGWRLSSDQDAGDLRINLTLRETSEAAFSWDAEEADIIANDTTLDNAAATQTPTLDAPVVTTHVNEDGTTVPSITFSWSVDNAELVSYYEFQFKTTGATDYNSRIVYDGEFTLSPALSNTAYNYRVRTFNQFGVKSAFVSGASTVSTGNDSTTPKAPTGVTVTGGYGAAIVTWTAPTQNTDDTALKDLFQYKVYRGTTTNPTTLVGRVSGEIFSDNGLADSTTYYYRIKAIDFTGNESEYSANGSGATNAALTNGVDGIDGNDGNDGNSVALLSVYIRASSAPSTPSGGSFNFSTTTLTAPTSWSTTPPSGSNPLYISNATASVQGSTGTDSSLTWSTPSVFAENGADGNDGVDGVDGSNGLDGTSGKSVYTAIVFQRASSAPSTPTGGSFNFGTNTLTAPTNWYLDIPSGSNPVYGTRAVFSVSGDTGTDSSPTWSTPFKVAEDGSDGLNGSDGNDGLNGTDGLDGADGLSTFLASVFQRSASAPSSPTGGSYNFGTNTLTAPTGWSLTVPTGSNPLYVSTTLASVQGITGTDSSLSWTSPVVLARDGIDGSDGLNGSDGLDGAQGVRGAGRWYVGVTSLPTTSSGADTAFSSAIDDPVDLDQAWFYTGTQSAPTAQSVWIYNGSTDTWAEQTEVIDGDLLVTGSINASKIAISDETASSRIEIAENKILIYDSGTLRVKLGDLS